MQLAKPAGLSQHSDTFNDDEDEEEAEKGEMGKRTEMKSTKVFLGVRLWPEVYEPKQFSDRFITVVLS